MAKAQAAARFMTEVAPPQFVSIMRRRKVPRSLDTIAEDDRELAYSDHHNRQAAAKSSASSFTAASLKRASPASAPTGGFMRELSKCFSNNVVHGQARGRLGEQSSQRAPASRLCTTVAHERWCMKS